MLHKYLNYIKDNPKGYWFKRKLFGWGWVPVRWQGFVVTFAYMGVLLGLGLNLERSESVDVGIEFIAPLIVSTVILITICYLKGEKPKWQWGLPEDGGW